jgi:fibronectin-binding autotransporter adhesin
MKIRTIITVGLLASTSILSAQTYTWNGFTTGGATGASDIWDTVTANWTGAGTTWPSSGTANDAIFGGTAGTVTIQAGGVTANKLTFDTTGYTISGAGLTMNGTTPTFAIGSGSATISSLLSGSAGFTKSGAGTLLLDGGNNPISGTVNVNGGILQVSATGGNQDGLRNVGTVNIDNATMQLLGTQGNRLNINVNLTVQNGGVLDAAGSASNQHNLGTVALNGGTLTSSGASSSGNFVLRNTVTVGGSALSTISAATISLNSGVRTFNVADVVAGSGVAGTDLLVSSTIANGGITKDGAGTLRLTGQNSYTLGTTVNAGTLILDSTGKTNPASILLSNRDLTINNALVTLVGNQQNNIYNTTNGTVTITSGTLSADQASSNNHHLYNVVLDGGVLATGTTGSFFLNAAVTGTGTAMSTISAPLILNSETTSFNVGDAVAGPGTAGTDLLVTGAITQNGGARSLTKSGAGTMQLAAIGSSYSGGTFVTGGTLILNSTGKTEPASGIIPANSNLTISDAAVSLVGNAGNNIYNQFGGTVTITSGTLSADQASNNSHHLYNVVLDGGVLTTGATGSFYLNAGVTGTGTAMSTISAPLNLQNGARTFNVGDAVAGTDLLVSSALSNGGVAKSGLGTMELTGSTSSYAGATTVSAGTLLVNQWLPNSAVTVDGGTLGGTGPIDQLTTIATGAFVAPGTAGVGTLSLQTASLAGTYQCEVGSSSADQLEVIGTLTVIPGATVAFTAIDTPTQAEYLIATYDILDGSLPAFTGVPTGYAVDTGTPGEIKLVQTGGAGGFDSWADSWTSPPLSDKTAGGDPDNDGISNLLEYVLGGDPRVSDTGILPKQKIEAGFLVLSYKRSDASEGDTQQSGQWSTDLVNWNSIVPVLVSENGTDADDMEIRIPLSNAVNGKLFGRLQVSQ